MTGALTFVFYVATFGTLAGLSAYEVWLWWQRRKPVGAVKVMEHLPPRFDGGKKRAS